MVVAYFLRGEGLGLRWSWSRYIKSGVLRKEGRKEEGWTIPGLRNLPQLWES